MPTRPKTIKQLTRKSWDHKLSSAARGYGAAHRRQKERLQRDEPLCRLCKAKGIYRAACIADHIIPIAEDGTDEDDNYQHICRECHDAKTKEEAQRGRSRCC